MAECAAMALHSRRFSATHSLRCAAARLRCAVRAWRIARARASGGGIKRDCGLGCGSAMGVGIRKWWVVVVEVEEMGGGVMGC
jgi:hypothetical protein